MSSFALGQPTAAAQHIVINQVEPEQTEEEKSAAETYVDDQNGNHDLPDDLKAALKGLLTHYGTVVDKMARRYEVVDARRQRHYDRGSQYIFFNWGQYIFVPITGGTVMNVGSESVPMPRYCNVYNIFKPYRRNFTATLTQNAPGVNFEPANPTNSLDIKIAEAAENYGQHYDSINVPKKLQAKMGRLFWTDGRVVGRTFHSKNAEKYGTYQAAADQEEIEDDESHGVVEAAPDTEATTEDEEGQNSDELKGNAKGEEITELYGVLEAKVFPITANSQDELLGVILSNDPAVEKAKTEYSWIKGEIKAGESGHGESAFERNCRLGTLQGMRSARSNDSYDHLAERHRMFLRPAAFEHADEKCKERLKQIFAQGIEAVFIGEVYAEAHNRSLDDTLTVDHALDGDGMNRPSWGKDMVPVQDAYNNYKNYRQEMHDYGAPWTGFDIELLDPNSVREWISQPGEMKGLINPQQGRPISDYFYQSEAATVPTDMIEAEQDLRNDLAQLVSGVQPALFGGGIAQGKDADTVGVYQMAREQAMGVMGLPWGVMQAMFARFKYQAVLAAAANRRASDQLHIKPKKQKGLKGKPISVSIADLQKGKFRAVANTDSTFPATRSMRKAAFQEVMAGAEANPMLQEAFMQPDNMELGAELEGLPEFDIPAARAWRRQKDEIDQLLATGPIPPSFQQLQAAAMAATAKAALMASAQGQKAQPLPAEQQPPNAEEYALLIVSGKWIANPLMLSMAKPSVEVDEEDYHQYHSLSIKDWFNSPERDKQIDAGNRLGIANLRLHNNQHKQGAAQEQAQAGGQGKPPSESINFKDLSPAGKVQMAAKVGIQETPQLPQPQPGAQAQATQ